MTEPSKPAMTMRQIREHLGHTIPPDAPEPPAAWVDGDPLMEAIAAAIWEHCETDGLSLVIDDPRNIAATAAAVARVSSSAPADRAAILRELADRADPANEASWFGDFGHLVGEWIRKQADYEERRLAGEARDERETQAETCGQTVSIGGTEYPPCGRRPNHLEAYCHSADGTAHFLAPALDPQQPEAAEGAQR
jgi:hypothetical protein